MLRGTGRRSKVSARRNNFPTHRELTIRELLQVEWWAKSSRLELPQKSKTTSRYL